MNTLSFITDPNFGNILLFQIVLFSVVCVAVCVGVYWLLGKIQRNLRVAPKLLLTITIVMLLVSAVGYLTQAMGY